MFHNYLGESSEPKGVIKLKRVSQYMVKELCKDLVLSCSKNEFHILAHAHRKMIVPHSKV